MVNFCGFRYATTSPITVFINIVFTFIFAVFFIFPYAQIKCLQHSLTCRGRVTVRLFFG